MNHSLVFQHTTFDIVDRDGQPWLRGIQIASALGYSDDSSITRIYARYADEFTDRMACTVKLTDQVQDREVRIFSLRGAHLLAMLSRTKVAKEFRKWVLDVIERHTQEHKPAPTLPELFASKRWLVHMTAEGHLVWNELQPDMVILSMSDMTKAIGKAWWGCVDTLADLNRICGKTGQKFDIPRKPA